ncbi:MAG: glycoside hydrolase family 88 protein [Lachnospiraceae bacterium]|nr:glycoside hydrolase family 88 protein [Lachnospiraceae bacterium]
MKGSTEGLKNEAGRAALEKGQGRSDKALSDALKNETLRLLKREGALSLKGKLKKMLGRGTEPDPVRWPAGMLMLGLFESGEYEEVESRMKKWLDTGGEIRSPEDLLAMQVFMDMCEKFPECGSRERISEKVRDFLEAWPRDTEGAIIYNRNDALKRVFADGIGMCCPVLSGIAPGLSTGQIGRFLEHCTDRDTGLPCHAYSVSAEGAGGHTTPEKLSSSQDIVNDTDPGQPKNAHIKTYGPGGWGRACGWVLMGIAGACVRSGDGDREKLREMYERAAAPVRARVREDGLWGSFLCEKDSHTDTSASAMILYSEALMGQDVSAGTGALKKYVTPEGRVLSAQGECRDAGDYSEEYGSYPWSVGMTLALFGIAQRKEGTV